MGQIIDFVLHLDKHIFDLIQQFGPNTYAILFAIIFAETGLVIFPFLPGDSLLFAVGMFCRDEGEGYTLNFWVVFFLLSFAAILGDQVNYRIGKALGPKVFKSDTARIFKKSHLRKTEQFFERFGAKTVIIARFVPIVRTFAPFVAGMGHMTYRKFCIYSVAGAFLWVGVCVGAGYLLMKVPGVRDNFEIAVLALILVSVLPMVLELIKHRKEARATASDAVEAADAAADTGSDEGYDPEKEAGLPPSP